MFTLLTLKGRIPSKKNSKQWIVRGGKKFLVPSKKHKEWHEAAQWEIMSQKPEKGIKRCGISMVFYMPDNRVADLTNKAESVMDLLVDCKVIKDDKWQVVAPLILDCRGIDSNDPRVIIFINSYE